MGDADWGGVDDNEDDNDEERGFDQFSGGRDSIVFLVDSTKPMFEMAGSGEGTPFELAIKCAINVLKNKIISSERDLIGVIFFGTGQSTNSNFKHIYVFQELEQPGAESILQLTKLLENAKDNFQKTYDWSTDFSLADALWTCSTIFSKCSTKLANRRVMLFTNEDHPHKDHPQLERQAIQRAKDLYENGIEVVLMPIMKPGSPIFDNLKFYKDIIMLPDDELDGQPMNVTDKFDELLTRVRTKDHKKRSTGQVTLTLPGDVNIAVSVYNLVRPLAKPTPVRLAKDTNEELTSMTKTYTEETGEILLPAEIKYYQEYGGKKIRFEKDEIAEIRQIFKPGVTLLGFQPASNLKTHYHVKAASFLYPDNRRIEGSTTLFAALLRKCIERNVIAICRYTPRVNSVSELVALVPQEEELDDGNVQVTPPGFHVVPLPYAEDFRSLNLQKCEKASEEQIEKAKAIIKKLKCSFKSESFENPVLQLHWRNIEALALDLDEPDQFIDYTLPPVEMIEKRVGKLIEEFRTMVYPNGYNPTGSNKRQVNSDKIKNIASKRVKPEIDLEEIAAVINDGKVQKLTVDVLKTYCQGLGYKTTGKKKAELIADLENHFSQK